MRLRPAVIPMALVVALFTAGACEPIVGTPPVPPPSNNCVEHPCNTYAVAPGGLAPTCADDAPRCEFPARPTYPITIVIHVPDDSYDAPGETFVATGDTLFSRLATDPTCAPLFCLPLPRLFGVSGTYRTRPSMAERVGVTAPDLASFPVRVMFVPLFGGSDEPAASQGLPLGPLFASSRAVRVDATSPAEALYQRPLPEGRYVRIAYPEPPFDEGLPPAKAPVTTGVTDDFVLGPNSNEQDRETPLDDPSGALRRATISRAAGLDGFRAWLADATWGWRISSRPTLRGVRDVVRLDTAGQSQQGGAIPENVDVIVAPPEGSIALPRLQSTLFGGAGLEAIEYPPLPPPAKVEGLVSVATPDGLAGIPSRVSFVSTSINAADGAPQRILRYETTVSTDEAGGLSTVLPIGTYDVLVEPEEGTGFGTTQVRNVEVQAATSALSFEPRRRSQVTGRAVLSDGRVLSQADVFAIPSGVAEPRARSQRTVTSSDGTFHFELDQGHYDIRIDPPLGTGFPRYVASSRLVEGEEVGLGFFIMPAPTRLEFDIRVPGQTVNPIVRATVRIFAERPGAPATGTRFVEVGTGTTDQDGHVQILLAHAPN